MFKIPFSKVNCDGNELEYVREVLACGWLTTAGKTHAFEDQFRERVGARFACAVNSGTAGLHLALDALNVGPGDEVLVPTMTFTATAEVVRYQGADPIFLDVEYGSSLVTQEILSGAVQQYPDAKVFMPVHFGGQAAPLLGAKGKGLLDLCRENSIGVVEDAAHAFLAKCQGRMIGSLGDVTCFSFYANKTITTAEGGMLTTDDPDIAQRVKVMRLHGIDRDVWDRFNADKSSWEYDVIAPGFKYNMPDVAAAIGLAQLERADVFQRERQRCARFYLERLSGLGSVDLPLVHGSMEDHAWHLFVMILNEQSPVSRNRFIEIMAQRGIGTSVHYKPLHRMTYYLERYNLRPEDFPNAERIWKGCVSLPIYPALSDDELDYICKVIWEVLG
ncbi:MAG: DegT/DnrJ/EryC1/StrS family aminotransferase [Desulfobaccales bacterium]